MRVARNYLLAGMAGVYLWSAASIPMRREALATESFSPTLYAEKDPSPGVRQLLSQFACLPVHCRQDSPGMPGWSPRSEWAVFC